MGTLADLINSSGLTAQWVWTHAVDDGPYQGHDVYALLLVIDTHDVALWGGDFNRRVTLIENNGQSIDQSQPNTGGEKRPPDLLDTLARLLDDSNDVDLAADFAEWSEWNCDQGPCPYDLGDDGPRAAAYAYEQAFKDMGRYETAKALNGKLRAFFGDDYRKWTEAAAVYLNEN